MNRSAIVAILAAAGATFSGPLTHDAVAYATALVSGSPDDIENFVIDHPQSRLVPHALIRIAGGSCDWTLGATGGGTGGCYGD